MCVPIMPASIYPSLLQAVQLASWEYMHAPIVPADIYLCVLQAVQPAGWEYIHAPNVPANTHCLSISPGPDQVTPPISIAGILSQASRP